MDEHVCGFVLVSWCVWLVSCVYGLDFLGLRNQYPCVSMKKKKKERKRKKKKKKKWPLEWVCEEERKRGKERRRKPLSESMKKKGEKKKEGEKKNCWKPFFFLLCHHNSYSIIWKHQKFVFIFNHWNSFL